MVSDPSPDARYTSRRRHVLAAAAWSVPALAVAAPAPAQAVSCINPTVVPAVTTAPAAGGGVSATASATFSYIVPTINSGELTFDIAGGAGGGATFAGSGARVRGTIAVSSGDVVSVVAGQGGYALANGQFNDNTGFTPGNIPGGQGFGNGGTALGYNSVVAPDLYNSGGSGGGGSAILVNGLVVAIAGGGGGMARGIFTSSGDPVLWQQVAPLPAKAGSGNTNVGIADLAIGLVGSPGLFAQGGSGLTGTSVAGGAAGTGSATFGSVTASSGNVGAGPSLGGAAGANGVYVSNTTRVGGRYLVSSGAGGGGYSGGGSGGGLWHTAANTTSGLALGGGGGGGANYVNPLFFPLSGPQPVQSLAGNESTSNTVRGSGWAIFSLALCQ